MLIAESGRQGLIIPLTLFRERVGGEASLRKILGALSVKEKVHPGRPKGMAQTIHKAYIIDKDTLIIPKIKGIPLLKTFNSHGLPLIDEIQISSNSNAPLPQPRRILAERLIAEEPLYPYQEAAIDYICSTRQICYLQMDTGLGKTRVGCGVIAKNAEPALVVVPTDAIAHQWVEEFSEIYPEMLVDVYHNSRSKKILPGPQTHDVVIIIINTFRNKTPEFLEGFGMVILDEAHEYHSTHNSKALWLSQTKMVLGLSATPDERPDGLDKYVQLHLGNVVYPKNIPNFDVCSVNFRGEVRIVEYTGHPDNCETATTPTGTMSAILTIGNIIKDTARQQLIASEAKRIYLLHENASEVELLRLGLGPRPLSAATPTHPVNEIRRHGVFVFAEHREYLIELRNAIVQQFNDTENPEDIIIAPELSMLRGGVSKKAVGNARKAKSHIVLTTYGFSRRGISLPDMTCIIAATPRRNGLRQILGRILRRGSDESIVRQIVDIVDVRTGLRSQNVDRRKIYKEKNYPITKVSASWENYLVDKTDENDKTSNDETFKDMSTDDLFALLKE